MFRQPFAAMETRERVGVARLPLPVLQMPLGAPVAAGRRRTRDNQSPRVLQKLDLQELLYFGWVLGPATTRFFFQKERPTDQNTPRGSSHFPLFLPRTPLLSIVLTGFLFGPWPALESFPPTPAEDRGTSKRSPRPTLAHRSVRMGPPKMAAAHPSFCAKGKTELRFCGAGGGQKRFSLFFLSHICVVKWDCFRRCPLGP